MECVSLPQYLLFSLQFLLLIKLWFKAMLHIFGKSFSIIRHWYRHLMCFTFDTCYLHKNILSRIGNDAIALLERFNMRDRICACYYYFYAGVAWHAVEPLQSCADKLTQAFSTGLSAGNT